jgi:hypothetical protein
VNTAEAARVSVRVLYSLVEKKAKEVKLASEELLRLEQELTALKALYNRTASADSDFNYPAFVEFCLMRDKRIGELLATSKCVLFDLGSLILKAPKVEAQMLHLFRKKIEEFGDTYFGSPVAMQVREDDS